MRRGRHPSVGQPDQPADHGEQRIELPQRAVGEPDPQPVTGMLRLGVGGVQPEGGGDQRREGLDVGAHHDDVPRLERRVVGQQPDQDLAQHLDLAVRSVRGVQHHAAVGGIEHRAGGLGLRLAVGGDVGLQPAEQGAGGRPRPARAGARSTRSASVAGQRELQLPRVPAEVGQQPMTAQPLGVVVDPSAAGRRPVPLQVVGHLLPQSRRRGGQPEVHVAGGGQRGQHRHVVGLQPGGAEHRQPGRQVDGLGSLPQRPDGRRHPLGRLRSVHARAQPSPQLGLPGPVGTQGLPGRVDVAMLGPGVQHGRPAGGVRGEQLGLVPGHRPAPTGAAVEVGPQQPGPRLVPGLVDDPQQRPDHLVGPPRVVLLGHGIGRRQRPRDQAQRRAEVDRRADSVGPPGPGAQPRGQPLAQPPLHPGRRHADDLGGERVRKRVAQQGPERVHQVVGALRAMDQQAHGRHSP